MKSYGKEVPYVKFRAKLKKLPIGEISGIISVVKDEHGNDKVLVSANFLTIFLCFTNKKAYLCTHHT